MAHFREYAYVMEKVDGAFDPLLNKLKEIIVVSDQLFGTQIHGEYGVYPNGFEEWLKKHPGFKTQPFTVTRIEGGAIQEIPYHIFYERTVKHMVKLFDEAKETLDVIVDASFDKAWWRAYFSVLQEAFRTDDWKKAEKYYLSIPVASPILLSIGPIDPYHDKLLGTKRYFSAWLLVQNGEQQEKTLPLWETLLKLANAKATAPIKLYIGDLLYSGGEVAKHNSMGWSRPENAEVAERIGAVKALAINKLPEHSKRMEKALFAMIEQTDISVKTSEALMQFHEHHSLIPLLLHEIGHTYDKRSDAHTQLEEYYQLIEETRANTNMVFLALHLEKVGRIPEKSARFIFLRVLFYVAYLYEEYTTHKHREEYLFAALLWFCKAEAKGIITVGEKHLTLNETQLETQLGALIKEIRDELHSLTEKGNKKEIETLKKETFTYGEKLADKLSLM